jgi:hypothetical protein
MKLGDDLMKVPKLEVTGSNWVIYKMRFSWSIDARGLLEHIDGSTWEPTKPSIVKKAAEGGSGAEIDVTEWFRGRIYQFRRNRAQAHYSCR